MSLRLETAPTEEPVLLADAKKHLRVDISDDDALIARLVKATTRHVENFTQRVLLTQTWEWRFDRFPRWHHTGTPEYDPTVIRVPKPPLQSVTSVNYIDPDGVEQTWDPAKYVADGASEPGRIYPAFNECYPDTRLERDAVRITFVAGHTTREKIPDDLIAGLLLVLGDLYENREDTIVGTSAVSLPKGAQRLLSDYQLPAFPEI